MTTPIPGIGWLEANQRYLTAALAAMRRQLEHHAAGTPQVDEEPAADEAAPSLTIQPAIESASAAFGLSSFERGVLLLCAAVELDSAFGPLCAAAQGDPARPFPTFSLALAALPGAHWSAVTPAAPLRRWRLIEVGSGQTLTQSPLRIDERILHFLAGVSHLDERLAGLMEPVWAAVERVPSHQALADRLAAVWSHADAILPVAQLCGGDPAEKRAIASAACASLGLSLHVLAAAALPSAPAELEALLRLWERESSLGAGALLLECDDLDSADVRAASVARLIERLRSPLIVTGREPRRAAFRRVAVFDVQRPLPSEQRLLWEAALGPAVQGLNGEVEELVSQFGLGASAITSACAEAAIQPGDVGPALWDSCRVQARARLDELAQRIEPAAAWDDLILPEAQRQVLREIAVHVRHRARVYDTWGFAGKSTRGLGVSALFAGASGTGKTMAAEVLAAAMRLDLYRIDLSQVVSKYIGETEKNLRRVFDAAEAGGAVLLFDEADALFGRRSEVKDSHDRYANIEVSYLLQRMESYRGLAILTTNLKDALDPAFLRRLRFVVSFPFPDMAQRTEIWRRVFPAKLPTAGLDVVKLARLNLAGGNIRNVALYAAFLAADEDEPVAMKHLLRAARAEYAKLERPLTAAEIGGWE